MSRTTIKFNATGFNTIHAQEYGNALAFFAKFMAKNRKIAVASPPTEFVHGLIADDREDIRLSDRVAQL